MAKKIMIIDGGPGLTPDPSPEGKGSKGEGRGEKGFKGSRGEKGMAEKIMG